MVKQAEAAISVGKYNEAADLYTEAWKQKQDKKEWRYLAGEAYLKAHQYKLAADALSDCTQMVNDFPMVNLYYARALKQNEQYTKAIPAFKAFLESYQESK